MTTGCAAAYDDCCSSDFARCLVDAHVPDEIAGRVCACLGNGHAREACRLLYAERVRALREVHAREHDLELLDRMINKLSSRSAPS